MDIITRAEFNRILSDFWGKYIERFQRLSPKEREEFTQRQGYPGLAGLLAHVVAWWQDGSDVIARMCTDPTLRNPDYDVDSFNADAVRRMGQIGDVEAAALYEQQRLAMVRLIAGLSDAELSDKRINTRLYYEIIQHAGEHPLA